MGRSPARYYLEIASTAPGTAGSVGHAGGGSRGACGFVSASHFSKCYRELYNRSPQQERADRKLTLQAVR